MKRQDKKEDEKIIRLQEGLKKELMKYDSREQSQDRGVDTRNEKTKKKKNPLKILAIMLAAILFLMVVAVVSFFILRQRGYQALVAAGKSDIEFSAPEKLKSQVNVETDGMVVYQGEQYRYNTNMANILLMGIDKENLNDEETVAAGDSGQADTLFLMSIDTQTGKSTIISIPRDTMVDVNTYTTQGTFIHTVKQQLCLAYAYGEGKELSCENTIRSVSRLLYGVPIASYAAIDMKAIGVLNDAVGGVEVEILGDLSLGDPVMKTGEHLTLRGQQAEVYVRFRNSEGPLADRYSNMARMERQRQYLSAFGAKVLAKTKEDITVPLTLYQAASDYMVTNVTPAKAAYLASLMLQNGFFDSNIQSVPGEVEMGEKYVEFYPEEEALYRMILDVFYEKISK